LQQYKIILIFDEYHDQKAINLINRLDNIGIQTLRYTQLTSKSDFELYSKKTDFIFALLTDDAPIPMSLVQNTEQLIAEIRNRDKHLYVIKEHRAPLPPDFQGYPILEPDDGTLLSPNGGGIAGRICSLVASEDSKHLLYEKLSAMKTIEYESGIQEALSVLCEMLCKELLEFAPWTKEPQKEIGEILRIFTEIDRYPTGYGKEEKEIARKILSAISHFQPLTKHFQDSEDLYCLACVLRTEELYHDIRASCVDTITTGDVHLYNEHFPEHYNLISNHFLSLLEHENGILVDYYLPEHVSFIMEEAERCRKIVNAAGKSSLSEGPSSIISQKNEKSTASVPMTETEKKLYDIAEFMSKGYALFESMSRDKTATDFLRCLKTSFERLKNYCNIIGAKEISARCIEYITQIDQQLCQLSFAEEASDTVEMGLKALLGLKLPNSGQYDVFISYKHEDEDIAKNVYRNLKSELLNVFFDKVTLPELSESDYDEAIMSALDHSRHFVVIITDLKQLETYWIKLEMKTFHHEMVEGRKTDANFIMLVTDQVFDIITKSNKTVLPLRYRSCEIIKIGDYKNVIYGYLSK